MKIKINEIQFRQIERICEIMQVNLYKSDESNLLIEGKIGAKTAQDLWKKIKNNLTQLRNNRDFSRFTDAEWDTMLRRLEKDEIYNLDQNYQKQLSKLIKLKFDDFIPTIYKHVVGTFLKDNPSMTYRDFITMLKNGSAAEQKTLEDLLKTGGVDGRAILRNPKGDPDYFAIDLIYPRLDQEIINLGNGKGNLEFQIETPTRAGWKERLARTVDKKGWTKGPARRALFQGMLRNEPGSKYFSQLVKTNIANMYRKYKKLDPLEPLTSEQKKIAMNWFVTGVADWRQVKNIGRTMGWKYALPNIAGQLFFKWVYLSVILSVISVVLSLIRAAPPSAEKMSWWDGAWERVFSEWKLANPGLTSPALRLGHLFIFTILKPAVEGRSEYLEAWDRYFSGQLTQAEEAIERVRTGQNPENSQLEELEQASDTPVVQGTPMPANDTPRTNTTFPTFSDSIPRNRTDSNTRAGRDSTPLPIVPGFENN